MTLVMAVPPVRQWPHLLRTAGRQCQRVEWNRARMIGWPQSGGAFQMAVAKSEQWESGMPRWEIAVAVVVLGLFAAAPASSEDYPTRPVTLVVPFPPGG